MRDQNDPCDDDSSIGFKEPYHVLRIIAELSPSYAGHVPLCELSEQLGVPRDRLFRICSSLVEERLIRFRAMKKIVCLSTVYSFYCTNHTPPHHADSEDERKELETKEGCKDWSPA